MPDRKAGSQPESIRAMLAARYRYSVGSTVEVAELLLALPASQQARPAARLVECLWDDDPGIALRASAVLERVSRQQPSVLNRWKQPLLALLLEATRNKLRWNLALMVPRLTLTRPERRHVAGILESWLDDPSSVVKTFALQGLADLAGKDASLLPTVLDLLNLHGRAGTPAMRARSRILLKRLQPPTEE